MRFLVADDHELVRDTVAAFLAHEGVGLVEKASSLDEAMEMAVAREGYDLVLLDYCMPGMSGLDGLARMQEANGGKPVALISGTATPDVADRALKAGAAGFIPKTMPSASMVNAARVMAAGEVYAPYAFLQRAQTGVAGELTARERDVLQGICEGLSNKEIARNLGLQEVTVKLHVKTLSRKLGARNRTHAAMIAKELALA